MANINRRWQGHQQLQFIIRIGGTNGNKKEKKQKTQETGKRTPVPGQEGGATYQGQAQGQEFRKQGGIDQTETHQVDDQGHHSQSQADVDKIVNTL